MSYLLRPIVSGFVALACAAATADEATPELTASKPSAEKPPAGQSAWQKHFRRQAEGYRLTTNGGDEPARLLPSPILYWTQPVRGGDDGAVYLWTERGRPVAIGTFFIWPAGDDGRQGVTNELHALTDASLSGVWKNRRWTVDKGEFAFQPLTAKEPPSDMRERRLLQMKNLARSFAATSHGKDERDWELRLLARPLYRYDINAADESPIVDGALFGFVQGTDLEIVLAIEAQRDSAGLKWRFACARMSDLPLQVKRDDITVWKVGQANFDRSGDPYYCGTVEYRKEPDAQ